MVAELGLPVMLKPVQEGSSLGVSKCKTPEQLESRLGGRAFRVRARCSRSGSCLAPRSPWGSIERDGRLEALPILQLVPKNEFYDYEAKYTEGMTEFILPARLEPAVYQRAGEAAVAAFDGHRLPRLLAGGHDGGRRQARPGSWK